jgi:hypothetical protein
MAQGTILFMSPGILTDAGGIEIFIGADGKPHVRKVPGNNPLFQEVGAAVLVLEQAARLNDKVAAQKFQSFAEAIIADKAKDLQHAFGQTQGASGD